MKRLRSAFAATAIFGGAAFATFAGAQELPPPAPAPDGLDAAPTAELDAEDEANGYSVLLRGPVHEAYAKPVTETAELAPVVTKAPPEPIEELPPEYELEGDDATWIPGYWGWDQEREDYVWVSGVWRKAPPGRRWVPGYWAEADGGYRWAPGDWVAVEEPEIAYLPPPPESVEEGPTSDPPSEEHFWIPGNWVYQETDYAWQPGFWSPFREGWVWVPAHYVHTPGGCFFVNGYWDFKGNARGLCFAPIYFNRPVYQTANWYYSPSTALDVQSSLWVNLWSSPQYCHYYFGDYYGVQGHYGMQPWYAAHTHGCYDPIYVYNNWRFSRPGYSYHDTLVGWNRYFVGHPAYRPPVTLAAQRALFVRTPNLPIAAQITLGVGLGSLVNAPNPGFQYRQVSLDARRAYVDPIRNVRNIAVDRARLERGLNLAVRPGVPPVPPPRLNLPSIPGTGPRVGVGGVRPPGRGTFDPGRVGVGRPPLNDGLPGRGPIDRLDPGREGPVRLPGGPGSPVGRPGLPGGPGGPNNDGLPGRGPIDRIDRDLEGPGRGPGGPGGPGRLPGAPGGPGNVIGRPNDNGLPGRGPIDLPDRRPGDSTPGGPRPPGRVPGGPGGPGARPGVPNLPNLPGGGGGVGRPDNRNNDGTPPGRGPINLPGAGSGRGPGGPGGRPNVPNLPGGAPNLPGRLPGVGNPPNTSLRPPVPNPGGSRPSLPAINPGGSRPSLPGVNPGAGAPRSLPNLGGAGGINPGGGRGASFSVPPGRGPNVPPPNRGGRPPGRGRD